MGTPFAITATGRDIDHQQQLNRFHLPFFLSHKKYYARAYTIHTTHILSTMRSTIPRDNLYEMLLKDNYSSLISIHEM